MKYALVFKAEALQRRRRPFPLLGSARSRRELSLVVLSLPGARRLGRTLARGAQRGAPELSARLARCATVLSFTTRQQHSRFLVFPPLRHQALLHTPVRLNVRVAQRPIMYGALCQREERVWVVTHQARSETVAAALLAADGWCEPFGEVPVCVGYHATVLPLAVAAGLQLRHSLAAAAARAGGLQGRPNAQGLSGQQLCERLAQHVQ